MLSGAPLRAILFDVGGPIVDERPEFVYDVEIVRSLLQEELGRDVGEKEVEEARDRAIGSWSPSFTKSVLWRFLKPDRERTLKVYGKALKLIYSHFEEAALMDGIDRVIPELASRYKLALAGNQPEFIRDKIESSGLLKYFTSTAVSGDLGLTKPDSRFFLEICRRVDEPCENCCMVGDRLDNDIYPANVLGMRTVWLRLGPHALQEPRVPEDVPDATIEHMSELLDVIAGWERELTQRKEPEPY